MVYGEKKVVRWGGGGEKQEEDELHVHVHVYSTVEPRTPLK